MKSGTYVAAGSARIRLHGKAMKVETYRMIRRRSRHTRYAGTRGRRVWRNKSRGMSIRRIGPKSGELSYMLSWPGGWGVVAAHDIHSMMKLLMSVEVDAEGRVV